MDEKTIIILKDCVFKISQKTESIENLIIKFNDSEISKIVDVGKLRSEIHKYCDNVLGHIDIIRGVL